MGLFSRDKPKIKVQTTKKDGFSGWLKCTHCTELIHTNELEQNFNCCPKCDYHYRLSAHERIKMLADKDSFTEQYQHIEPLDPLNFVDTQPYSERLANAKETAGSSEAVVVGTCTLNGHQVALGVMNFNYMAGSMGSVVGERLTLLIEQALHKKIPLVIVATSGGARMQESILSLMQMAKTSASLARLHEAKIPYISVLTNPTAGGITASFASLGDIIIAEPNALICFAGPRVIEQTLKHKLPPDAQKSEFLLKHGMIDAIVRRHDLKSKLTTFLEFLSPPKPEDKKLFQALQQKVEKPQESHRRSRERAVAAVTT
ncbi:MAG: acetyl-CoA carboxylase, carboxyltransferase subunit beta [Chlamydiales bacterium]|nr:acetyl-CoA carboxylase, carboxyltransferase subunit beta [Chlamydiales bacterium]